MPVGTANFAEIEKREDGLFIKEEIKVLIQEKLMRLVYLEIRGMREILRTV